MEELIELVERFQKLKEKTGTSKVGSYSVAVYFDTWTDNVLITFGGYDVPTWSRNEVVKTDRLDLQHDFLAKVKEAERLVEQKQVDSEF